MSAHKSLLLRYDAPVLSLCTLNCSIWCSVHNTSLNFGHLLPSQSHFRFSFGFLMFLSYIFYCTLCSLLSCDQHIKVNICFVSLPNCTKDFLCRGTSYICAFKHFTHLLSYGLSPIIVVFFIWISLHVDEILNFTLNFTFYNQLVAEGHVKLKKKLLSCWNITQKIHTAVILYVSVLSLFYRKS